MAKGMVVADAVPVNAYKAVSELICAGASWPTEKGF
jgi:hypothetical protein